MKEKASIEANLHVLKQEKEATAASKEAAIFEEAAAEQMEKNSLGELQDLTLEDQTKRIRDYIETQPFEKHALLEPQDATPLRPIPHDKILKPPTHINNAENSVYESHREEDNYKFIAGERYAPPPAPKAFFPKQEYSPVTPYTLKKNLAANFQTPDQAQYLMRKEMVSSGLLVFDDCPENYWA